MVIIETALVICKTLEDEVNLAIAKTGNTHQTYWIESGLHNYPDKLKIALQECIDSITGCDYIVLIFGLCGNALLGLKSRKAALVIPRVDDCISLFLGGNSKRRELENSARAYYLTKGWLRYENNIWKEYQRSLELYGLEKTRKIFGIMLKHYTHLVVIDTGAYDTTSFLEETRAIAAELGLEHAVIPGDLELITRAIKMDWEDGFVQIDPGREITLSDMGSCQNYIGQSISFPGS